MPIARNQLPEIICHPRVLWVGIGCNQGTAKQLIEAAIQQVLRENQLQEEAVAGIASIDIKANEAGLIELCRERNLPLKTFSADVLRTVCVPNPDIVVGKQVGTPSVAEAAALRAAFDLTPSPSGQPERGGGGVRLLVSKQIFRSDGFGAVTVAVATQLF